MRGRGHQSMTPTLPPSDPNSRIDPGLRVGVPNRFAGWGHQSTIPTPPPRLSASFVGTDNLGRGVGVVDWRPPTFKLIGDSESEFPINSRAEAANRRPRPLHQGRWRPPWLTVASVKGLGSSICCPSLANQSEL
ncbi:hypothetical protein CRG98_035544 [Punica granatum]|uniref:Uncharacterized protein n=1 Tax=Punica granatum TaxID=22663 RepID=A0A2I0IJD0_PUNGR|nr:hypothetical protein CRG98_035544 [Punica granatum]